jgi:hypothetical protein
MPSRRQGPRHGLEMKHASELEAEARRKRSTADRARRLARLASSPQDQVQMEQLAKDLDRQPPSWRRKRLHCEQASGRPTISRKNRTDGGAMSSTYGSLQESFQYPEKVRGAPDQGRHHTLNSRPAYYQVASATVSRVHGLARGFQRATLDGDCDGLFQLIALEMSTP